MKMHCKAFPAAKQRKQTGFDSLAFGATQCCRSYSHQWESDNEALVNEDTELESEEEPLPVSDPSDSEEDGHSIMPIEVESVRLIGVTLDEEDDVESEEESASEG